jgi:protein TonB
MRYVFLLFCYWLFLGKVNAQRATLVATVSSQAGPGSSASVMAENAQAGAATAPAPEVPAAIKVYDFADELPAFPGGPAAFAQYMRRTLQYPDAALAASISGKVYVRFTVSEDGRLLDPEVIKGIGYGLDQEALRLVRLMPWWTPGKVSGQPVRVRYVLPLVFRAL